LVSRPERQKAKTIYVVVGVVVGLVLVGFIGGMVTIRHWVALKNRLTDRARRRTGADLSGAEELKDSLQVPAKTPETD